MSEWKLIDYPHCAVCEHSEQYGDNTFICTLLDDEPEPLEYGKCDELVVNNEYLVGYLTLLTELIKKEKEVLSTNNMLITSKIKEAL